MKSLSRKTLLRGITLLCLVGVPQMRPFILFGEMLQQIQETTRTAQEISINSAPDTTISLVISFWVEPTDSDSPQQQQQQQFQNTTNHQNTTNLHRSEVEAAMIANLANPYLSQLVVILDGVSSPGGEADCIRFEERMRSLYNQHVRNKTQMAQLTCIPREKQQPTYLEMFQYTQHEAVCGRVVMISNADHAFDESLWRAGYIKPKTILTLSTRGFITDPKSRNAVYNHTIPSTLQQYYKDIVGDGIMQMNDRITPDRCKPHISMKDNSIIPFPLSWDTFIFDRQLLQGKLMESHFLRNKTGGHYYMNQWQAENAALRDLLVEVLGSNKNYFGGGWNNTANNNNDEVFVWNACQHIYSYHFHFAPKMHHDDNVRIPGPHAAGHMLSNHPDDHSNSFFFRKGITQR